MSGRLWRATSRAVVFSDDGVAWTSCTRILTATQMTVPIYGVWARGSLVLAGTGDGLYGSLDGGMTWALWLKPQIDYYIRADLLAAVLACGRADGRLRERLQRVPQAQVLGELVQELREPVLDLVR